MSEDTEVEQPFLHQLQAPGWDIIDQGRLGGLPILRNIFQKAICS